MKDKQRAIQLLDETFNCDFNTDRYSIFIKELFNEFNITQRERHAWSEFKSHIDTYQFLGSYTDNSKKSIDVLAVKLKSSSSIDRARTKQRNFVAKYLGNNNKDAALVAFYGDDKQDWRFSFVKLDYQLERDESGKVKPVEDLTPAKRYSYLVGVNEPNHTCKSQFLDLIIKENTNPSIAEIEDAFSIDNVTKEFFSEYKELFSELKESLARIIEKHPNVKEEFDQKSISTVDFSKKLLGQIVFIYFLQKKGWLGVGKDKEAGKFKEWGEGPKKFLRKLFDKEIIGYDKFFNEILEPLFYEALSKEYDHNFYSRFDCKIPFLNGGLFEPINDYDWVNVKIPFENKIFEDILGTFDRFNFTVKEDEPLDKEVAVDPEMLGKVFENLLTVTDRKSKGAFYTPREIVHYMCQQSLINYLETNTDVPVGDIETFIQHGELAQQITSRADVDEKYIPASIKNDRDKINTLLKDIKIVDPAVGSGAFPMGMMNEIVKARSILSYLRKDVKNNYDLKRETIENCLYGVDIDSSAVDITKLRFWLSLVVDESDIKKIKPLPNLDHRIMCGNSLLEEFEGIKLFDEQLLEVIPETGDFELEQVNAEIEKLYTELGEIYTGKRKDNGRKKQIGTKLKKLERKRKAILSRPKDVAPQSTFDSVLENRRKESQKKLAELKRLQKAYFNEQNRRQKKELAENIDKIEWELVEETLKEQGHEDAMEKLAQYKKNKSKPFFLWKLNFSDVFQRKNPGFDVVIGNPPYVKESTHKQAFDGLRKSQYYEGKMDIWYFFGCISIDILRNFGSLSYIATNNWISNDGASILRNKILREARIMQFIDFGDHKIFSAGIQTMVFLLCKNNIKSQYDVYYSRINNPKMHYTQLNGFLTSEKSSEDFTKYIVGFKPDNYYNKYIRFNNKKTEALLTKLIEKSDFSINNDEIFSGIDVLQDFVTKKHLKKLDNGAKVGDGIFVISDKEKINLNFNKSELEIIKPYYTTKELNKYFSLKNNRFWIIYSNSSINNHIRELPNIKEHLDRFTDIMTSVNKPYGLHRARNEKIFLGEKLLVHRKSTNPIFTLVDFPCYVSRTFLIIKSDRIDNKFLISLLNSKLVSFWLYFKGKLQGNQYQIDKKPLLQIPLKKLDINNQQILITFVDQIFSITNTSDYFENPTKQARVKTLQKQIDLLVYKLYDLTPEEIEIVEGFNGEK